MRKFQKGFSLLEVSVVLIVISLLLYLGVQAYDKPIKKSEVESLRYQAGTFSRTINTLQAQGVLAKSQKLKLKDSYIYLNENGWPANTNPKMSPKSSNQTPEECQQIWNALYELSPPSEINISKVTPETSYFISSINGRICRYELIRKQDGHYFFDYYLGTGKVIVSLQD